jgi:hypothetical protein
MRCKHLIYCGNSKFFSHSLCHSHSLCVATMIDVTENTKTRTYLLPDIKVCGVCDL